MCELTPSQSRRDAPFTKDKAGYLAARAYLERVTEAPALMSLFETIEQANLLYHTHTDGE